MSLPVYQNTIVNDRGDVLPEALLRVRTDPGQGNVTLYKDRDAFDVLTNVGDVYADTEGFVRFYLPPGVYRLHIVSAGYERSYRHVQVAPLNECNVVSAEQYTLAITDAGNNVQFIANNPIDVEIPADETVEFPMWTEIDLIQAGDGIITLSGDVTIQNPSGGPVKSMGKGSSIKLTLIGGNVWLARVSFDRIIDGDIEQKGNFKRRGELDQIGTAWIDNVQISGSTVRSSDGGLNISGSFVRVSDRLIAAGELWAQDGIDVTGTATISEDLAVGGDAIFHGNLTVKGTATIIDSTEVDIGDNIIRLNANETGQPTLSAGFEVERGLQANVNFLWDEFNKRWTTGTQKLHSAGFVGDGSEITNVGWGNVSGKPETATRWPAWGEVSGKPVTFPPSSHTHPASQIIDSTAVGRAVLTAADAGAARAAIGAIGGEAGDLGTAAYRNVGTASGNVMEVGAAGILKYDDLREQPWAAGPPSGYYGKGTRFGFVSEASVGLGASETSFGVGMLSSQYPDSTGSAGSASVLFLGPGTIKYKYQNGIESWKVLEAYHTDNTSAIGQAVMTAASQAAARDAIGAASKAGQIRFTGSRSLAASDLWNTVLCEGAGTLTVGGVGVVGATVTLIITSPSGITLAQGAGINLWWMQGGSAIAGNRAAAYGSAVTLYRATVDQWFVFGNGIS